MTTAHMLPVAERMDRCGFAQIDLAGTIQFDVCVRYLKENPWECHWHSFLIPFKLSQKKQKQPLLRKLFLLWGA